MAKKGQMKPYPFEKLMQNCGAFKQHREETVDGLGLNVMFPMGNQWQVGGQWNMSNTKGGSFEMTSVVTNHDGTPYMTQEDV